MIVEELVELTPDHISAVVALVGETSVHGGRSPLSEQTMLRLRPAPPKHMSRHFLVRDAGRLVGYGALDASQEPMVAELAVAPTQSSGAVGTALLSAMVRRAGTAGLALWTHGRDAPPAALATSMGLRPRRTLLQMGRSLCGELAARPIPAGYRVRTFRPGIDDDAVLAANAASFVDLPDQGSWGRDDLAARLAEPWFDAAGFFLAEALPGPDSDGLLAGFHWTKMHPPQPLGEIYVLGVTPRHRGTGLAAALAVHGLRHLRTVGATGAMLYVDESNTAAVRLYRRLGFDTWDVDRLFATG